MDNGGADDEPSRRVHVRFVTKLKPPYKVPSSSIAIPSNLTRMGLSAIVNNLLEAGNDDWQLEPFDFLIGGEFIRMSLEEFLVAKGISAEKVLEIEYVKAAIPRREEEPSLHDDWVSAIDGSNPGFILTGCYDNLGRVWKNAGLCSHILEGHGAPVTSITVVSQKGMASSNDTTIATASKDKTVRLWKFDVEDSTEQSTRIRAYKILSGHNASIQSVAADPSGDRICSGSWDCSIKLWQTHQLDAGSDQVSTKKRKTGVDDVEAQIEGEASSTLVGHTQCVSSVSWPELSTIYSASWDHSIRKWDIEREEATDERYTGKVVNCLDVGGESSALIATGSSDPILRIWDPRKPGTTAPIFQFSSHSSWISSCKWHKTSWFHLTSASYDGKVMLWDLRTAWPLAIIDSHNDKVLCVDWWKSDSIVSGGADSKLCISSGISIQ